MPCRGPDDSTVIVRDACFQRIDNYGDEICVLNGCGDILNQKAKYRVLLPFLIMLLLFVVSYSVGLYFNVILTKHYHNEYKRELEAEGGGNTRAEIEFAKTREGLRNICGSVCKRRKKPNADVGDNGNISS